MVTRGNLTRIAGRPPIPIREVAGIAAALVVSGYSRDMERQADVLDTRVLAMADYAADGLHNLMLTLESRRERGHHLVCLRSQTPRSGSVGP
jgi:hypothetical protein